MEIHTGAIVMNGSQALAAEVVETFEGTSDVASMIVTDSDGIHHDRPRVRLLCDGEQLAGYGFSYADSLAPHQRRVVIEKAELDEKLSKLIDFFATPTFEALAQDEKSRLRQQSHAMDCYSLILGERIAAF